MPPRSELLLPNGSKVLVEGTPEEIARIALLIGGGPASETATKKTPQRKPRPHSSKPKGATDHIRSLKAEGFFKTGKTLDQVREALKEKGYIDFLNLYNLFLINHSF